MIFQEPMTSLNPSFTIGDQIVEAVRRHRAVGRAEAKARADRDAAARAHSRTRAALRRVSAQALRRHAPARDDRDGAACDPSCLIADEPTTALDVTIQAQILDLLRRLRAETGTAIISSPTTSA
jgi:peptide/nickel transport system ATP-binding protein